MTVNDIGRFSARRQYLTTSSWELKKLQRVWRTLRPFFGQMTRKNNLTSDEVLFSDFSPMFFFFLLIFLPICFKMFYNTVYLVFFFFSLFFFYILTEYIVHLKSMAVRIVGVTTSRIHILPYNDIGTRLTLNDGREKNNFIIPIHKCK